MPKYAPIIETRLASGEFRLVDRPQSVPGRQFTTAKTIEAEHEIIRSVRQGQNQIEPVLSRPQAVSVADRQLHLNRAQKAVVEDVLSCPDRIQGIQGFAGSGKTTTLTAIRIAAERQGPQIEGFTPTSRAARQLNEAGIQAATLQAFLARGQMRNEM
jgi:ATP-dependent exoDNAse (exonuclease V) alpha subunit